MVEEHGEKTRNSIAQQIAANNTFKSQEVALSPRMYKTFLGARRAFDEEVP